MLKQTMIALTSAAAIGFGFAGSAEAAGTFDFTTCGATGAFGPTQAECDAEYGAGYVSVLQGIQNWIVPTTGTYEITAVGAQGASAQPGRSGGRGATIMGEIALTAGDLLQLLVGQAGQVNSTATTLNGSGGGGSFVVDASDNPLLIAGGGGGTRAVVSQDGCDASITEFGIIGSGGNTTSSCASKTTSLGLGGIVSAGTWGSGGAGFFGDGFGDNFFGTGGDGGNSWANGMTGGVPQTGSCSGRIAEGGFGGGGTGNGCGGGGGGGGYSGGDGGRVAGGGGSFNGLANPSAMAGLGLGDGTITISLIETEDVPEPASLLGLAAIGAVAAGGVLKKKAAA